jgi:O-antigen ligase
MSQRMAWLIGLGATAILIGVATGIYHDTQSPFGDWRNLATGLLFAFGLWSTVVRTDRDCFRFAQIFVAIMAAYGADQLLQYASGGGEIAFYGRTTVGDHATLEFMVAAVGISMAMLRLRRTRLLWWAGIAIGTSVVALAFRRYAWVELAVVFAAFVLLSGASRRRYLLAITGVAAVCVVTVGLTWSSLDWGGRLASIDPSLTRAQNVYATTNQGHINDILDGLDEVRAHPVAGLGVGVLYHGSRTAQWKGDAGMVHNAPIEVWIKFGLLGLGVFLATYVILFRDIWRRRNRGRICDVLAFGAGAFLLGNFVIIATVYSWPFGAWEKGILIFAVIAMAYPPGWRERPAPVTTPARP